LTITVEWGKFPITLTLKLCRRKVELPKVMIYPVIHFQSPHESCWQERKECLICSLVWHLQVHRYHLDNLLLENDTLSKCQMGVDRINLLIGGTKVCTKT